MTSIERLRDRLLKARHAYYDRNAPILSDAEYDALEDQLRALDPHDPVLALVGSPVPSDSLLMKARHSIAMGSQNKVNSEAEFRSWAQKAEGGALHASLKGDGASAAAYYAGGVLRRVISRGDGEVGEDISSNAMRFKGLPAWAGSSGVGFSGAVRFEVILTMADWAAIDPGRSKNPRNAGSGIMGRKNGEQSEYLSAYAFDLDESVDGNSWRFATESEKASRLEELGFIRMPDKLCATLDEAVGYFREIAAKREHLPFWIDGVVFKINDLGIQELLGATSGRPKGQIAWKFDSSGVQTRLLGVLISGGHTGSIVPTGQLQPVEIGGTTVSSVSLVNFDEIRRLDLAVGDTVWVIKANDIIPKIIQVTERPPDRRPIGIPSACPFCGGPVGWRINSSGDEGAILECKNGACPKKASAKIDRWISSLDILGIGDVVLESMIEHLQIEDAADLYALKTRARELAEMPTHKERELKLGAKRAQSILEAIEARRSLSLSQFLGALGIEHLGKRRVELMIASAKGALDTLDDWRSGKLRDPRIAEVAGVPNMALRIQDAIDANAQLIEKMLANGVELIRADAAPRARASEVAGEGVGEVAGESAGEGDEPSPRTVCISGKLASGRKKADYALPLKAAGYTLVDEVTASLDLLVVGDPESTSAKAVKARKLGIRVIGEAQLEALLA